MEQARRWNRRSWCLVALAPVAVAGLLLQEIAWITLAGYAATAVALRPRG